MFAGGGLQSRVGQRHSPRPQLADLRGRVQVFGTYEDLDGGGEGVQVPAESGDEGVLFGRGTQSEVHGAVRSEIDDTSLVHALGREAGTTASPDWWPVACRASRPGVARMPSGAATWSRGVLRWSNAATSNRSSDTPSAGIRTGCVMASHLSGGQRPGVGAGCVSHGPVLARVQRCARRELLVVLEGQTFDVTPALAGRRAAATRPGTGRASRSERIAANRNGTVSAPRHTTNTTDGALYHGMAGPT